MPSSVGGALQSRAQQVSDAIESVPAADALGMTASGCSTSYPDQSGALSVDETHDPARTSWVPSAQGHPDFPIQNLPFGIFHRVDDKDDPSPARVGIAIGDFVLDLTACHDEGWFTGCRRPRPAPRSRRRRSTRCMALGPDDLARASAARPAPCSRATRPPTTPTAGSATTFWSRWPRRSCCSPPPSATTPTSTPRSTTPPTSAACSGPTTRCCPTTSGCRSAITAGRRRSCRAARRCGGRAGRSRTPRPTRPVFGPTRALDYEMEVGCFVADRATRSARRCRSAEAEAHLFGLCLVNDWSARDVQSWEYQPLGPVPGEELRDHGVALGGDARRARAVPRARRPAPRRRSRAPAVPAARRPTQAAAAST